ncbi:ribosome production factor 2 homolog [Macrosteles quadrilineatus]|uniref:ribosome production factor 2 homolog n=1 Tax=Macrosteles quadrilineatus TaxID=74068 RepID=UPI0023E31230|nr:ribosome production factor 2 homolog [Macrosteles quadrilineatus]
MPAVMQRIVRPITHKGKKALIDKEPKLIENTKQCLFIKGKNTSDITRNCLLDLYLLKKPDAVNLNKKNDILPFENIVPVEGFARKYNASLFAFASHSKKRPHNVIIGRMYDDQLLDMVELGIESYKGFSEFTSEKVAVGIKPCLLFAGPQFDQNPDLKRFQNLLVDFLQRETVKAVRLQGLEHVIMFTADGDKIYMRSYRVVLKKSGSKTPRVELEEVGPAIDFKLRRTKLASDDLYKLACKRPKALKAKKVKNIAHDAFGTKLGRIHMTRQNIDKLQTRKMKGLKKSATEKKLQKKQRAAKKPITAK